MKKFLNNLIEFIDDVPPFHWFTLGFTLVVFVLQLIMLFHIEHLNQLSHHIQ